MLKQSAARWCYSKIPLEDLCRAGARMGLKGIDLVNHDEWPVLRKHGLVPAMTPGAGTIANAWNRKEDHDKLEREMRDAVQLFEPRIMRQTLMVKATMERNIVSFELYGELWANPIPEKLFIKTKIDLETGQCNLGDGGNG